MAKTAKSGCPDYQVRLDHEDCPVCIYQHYFKTKMMITVALISISRRNAWNAWYEGTQRSIRR